ncbi:Tetratricopeptide TPR_4 [Leptothrix cholodnii SP-6]|uniref:Tetratricopeptide TPR_4 n=1 Tax=Leptothrix cholodnii (strain ATCC 51168 / LMG 8142 / SP-6) TaxID=395495 RepID=B1XXN3_LEPCP|nr:AAA family ATPase [Leptothrix cholodnii]ACB36352.1 Tetratricopeptide TPR_4 [Leptothrix cholodnii SP-6]
MEQAWGKPPAPVILMIVREAAWLSCALSDGHGVGIHAQIRIADPAALQAGLAERDAAPADTAARQALGGRVWLELLPAPIRRFLHASPARVLTLQLGADLAGLPWELAFDGTRHLDEKFALARQILRDEDAPTPPVRAAAPEQLRVLVLARLDPAPAADAAARALIQGLRRLPGLHLTALDARELAGLAQPALAALGLHDIVHCCGIEPRLLAGPQLLVWEPPPARPAADARAGPAGVDPCATRLTMATLAWAQAQGTQLLVHPIAPAGFMPVFYGQLASGQPLGEAARRARIAAREQGDACWLAHLQGDAQLTLLRSAGRAPQPDHLRQVTMLSCDMVDSTRLMRHLGSEAYSEILLRYHGACAAVVGQHGGVADDPQGDDGVMCYFGFPQAAENAAVLALRAGLELLRCMADAGIAVRLGVATGQIVVRAGQPVGAAVHYAARLQAIAAPATLLASEETRRVAGERFEFRRLEQVPDMKGFDRPEPVYRVLGESALHGTERFDARSRLSPFVGRDKELARLRAHWRHASAGQCLAIYVSGDAGIGKSRLVREFRRAETGRGQLTIEWRCAREQSSSALYPVTDFLRRHLRLQAGDAAPVQLARLAASSLTDLAIEPATALALAANLLSIETGERHAVLDGAPERLRQQTLELLQKWLWRIADSAPLCLIIEDVHWIDPTTSELLGRVTAERQDGGLMLLMTGRPEPEHQWAAALAAEEIALAGLSDEMSRAMVAAVCEGSRVDAAFVQWLVERADGVPLFIEESARMALDIGAEEGTPQLRRASLQDAVPTTIHDLLMARLDRMPLAKHVAQVASAIGREVARHLIEAVCAHERCPIAVADLDEGLALLVRAGLLIPKGSGPGSSFLFKHALVRDAAYGSMWGRDRKRLHAAIAHVIQDTLPQLAELQPELLARHCAEAGMAAEALVQWERAARRSAARSAQREAITHLGHALAALEALPAGLERDRIELRLQLMRAGRLIATEGYGADQVEAVYGRALALCRQLDDPVAMAKALFGLEGYHFMRADFGRARAISEQAAELARHSSDPMAALQSQWVAANLLFHQGELRPAVERMDSCLAAYQTLEHRPNAVQDPGVMCLCYSSWALWQLGQPDQALQRATRVVELARRLNHPFSMAEAFGFITVVQHFRGDHEAALHSVEQALRISEDGGFSVWLAHAQVMHGRLLAQGGEHERGVALMRSGYERWSASGAVVTRPFYLAMQAEGLALAGRPDEGLGLLDSARALIEQHHERYFEPEVLRLTGELTRQLASRHGGLQDDVAEAWFERALASADEMQQHGLALRCACSLAALWQSADAHARAGQLIERHLRLCTEGSTTADLRRARALLAAAQEHTRGTPWSSTTRRAFAPTITH